MCPRPGRGPALRMPGLKTDGRFWTCSAEASFCSVLDKIRLWLTVWSRPQRAAVYLFEVIHLDEPDVVKAYERRLVLVRPDGHVAWRGNEGPADPVWMLDRVRGAAEPSSGAETPTGALS